MITIMVTSFSSSSSQSTSTHHDLSEFDINNWPVPLANEPYLEDIKSTHDVQQIPAFDIRNESVHPSEYEEKLAGAIARVCFLITHFIIKQKHVYNALVKDITIIRPPTTISTKSLKHVLHPKKKQKTN